MLINNKTKSFTGLIFFSILSGLLWRSEIEYHGWEGLIWLSYFHLAIPAILLLFFTWVNVFFSFKNKTDKVRSNLLLLTLMLMVTPCLIYSLESIFIAGPQAMMFHESMSSFEKILLNGLRFVGMPFLPFLLFFSLKWLNISIPVKHILQSFILYILSFPIAIQLLVWVGHKGGADAIHAIKSGFIFPLLFFSLGFPLIYANMKLDKNAMHSNVLDDVNINKLIQNKEE